MTQIELNKLYELPEMEIAVDYAYLIKTMFFTAVYAPVIPLGTLISCFGLIIQYWIDKYSVIRKRTINDNLSSVLSADMLEIMEFFIPIFAGSNYFFEKYFTNQVSPSTIAGLVIALVNMILPINQCIHRLCSHQSSACN